MSSFDKLKYFISIGAGLNVFTQKQTTVITEFVDHTDFDRSTLNAGYSKFNIAALAGAGVSYSLTERLELSVNPYFRRFINSVNADSRAKEYPYSLGISTALYYKYQRK